MEIYDAPELGILEYYLLSNYFVVARKSMTTCRDIISAIQKRQKPAGLAGFLSIVY